MKEIKQKPAGGKPKTADAARVPKAVVKAAWLQAREAARAGEKQVVGGKDLIQMAWNYLVGNGKELHFIGPFIKKMWI